MSSIATRYQQFINPISNIKKEIEDIEIVIKAEQRTIVLLNNAENFTTKHAREIRESKRHIVYLENKLKKLKGSLIKYQLLNDNTMIG